MRLPLNADFTLKPARAVECDFSAFGKESSEKHDKSDNATFLDDIATLGLRIFQAADEGKLRSRR